MKQRQEVHLPQSFTFSNLRLVEHQRNFLRLATTAFFVAALTVTHLNADPINVTFIGSNGQTDNSGYLISPYSATLNGASTTIYCNDFANEVTNGQTWTANVTDLVGGNLSNTRYGGLTQTLQTPNGSSTFEGQQLYDMAAYLTTQFKPGASSNGDVQDTIWDLFNPNGGNPGVVPPQPSTNAYLFAAENSLGTFNVSDFHILTNTAPVNLTGPGQVQEFLVPTPEPASMFLLGAGLVVLSIFGGRLLRREETSL